MVDDEDGTRWVLKRALEREGWGVVATKDPADLLAALDAGEVGLVLLDLRLGDQDGLDLLRRVRDQSAETPVVIITGHGTMETAIEAMQRGAYDYLVKPLDVDEVTAVARRALASGRREAPEAPSVTAEPVETVVGKSARMQETRGPGKTNPIGCPQQALCRGTAGTDGRVENRRVARHRREDLRAPCPFRRQPCGRAAYPRRRGEGPL